MRTKGPVQLVNWLIGTYTLHIGDIGREKVFSSTCQINFLQTIIWIVFSNSFSRRARTDSRFAMFHFKFSSSPDLLLNCCL